MAPLDQVMQLGRETRAIAAAAGQGVVGADGSIQRREFLQGQAWVAPAVPAAAGVTNLDAPVEGVEQTLVALPDSAPRFLEGSLPHRPRANQFA